MTPVSGVRLHTRGGTWTKIDNWIMELAPTLPGCAGWVLMALARELAYGRGLSKAQLMEKLERSETAIRVALNHLLELGVVLRSEAGWYFLTDKGQP